MEKSHSVSDRLEEVAQGHADTTNDEYWVITPEDAASVSLGGITSNRPPKTHKIRQYASDMREGRWIYNGVPIIIAEITDRSDTNILMDGQNRLMAIIESGVTITMRMDFIECSFDEAMEMMTTYDQGAVRSLRDIITIARKGGKDYAGYTDGDLAMSATAIGIADILIAQDEQSWRLLSRPGLEAYGMDHESDLRWGAEIRNFFNRRFKSATRFPVGVLAAAIVIHRLPRTAIAATGFFEQLATGDDLRTGNPIKILREELMMGQKSHFVFGIKGSKEHVRRYNATIRAWNAWVRGSSLTQIRVSDDPIDPIPYKDWDFAPDWAK